MEVGGQPVEAGHVVVHATEGGSGRAQHDQNRDVVSCALQIFVVQQQRQNDEEQGTCGEGDGEVHEHDVERVLYEERVDDAGDQFP